MDRLGAGGRLAYVFALAGGLTVWAQVGHAGDRGVVGAQLAQSQDGQPAPPPAVDKSHPRAKLVLGSNNLAGKIFLVEPRFRKIGNFTQAQLTIENRTTAKYILEYKFTWHDQDWFNTGQKTVWHRFSLTPNQVETLQSVGKTSDAANITLTVRFPDDATIN